VAKGIYEHTFEDASLRSASLVGYRGETLVALWYDADGQRVLRDLLRVETSGAKIARVRYYYFCPEVLQAVGHELGIPVRTQGYCYPRP
jgi:RNA polymerase sigma-70 factor (ECF subfamily)